MQVAQDLALDAALLAADPHRAIAAVNIDSIAKPSNSTGTASARDAVVVGTKSP